MSNFYLTAATALMAVLTAASPHSHEIKPLAKHIPRQFSNSTMSSIPSSTTTSATPSSTETWTIDVKVGESSFYIGDADPTTFRGLWDDACNSTGCDEGTSVDFDYKAKPGFATRSGSFTMEGTIHDDDDELTSYLLDAINASLLASKTCSTDTKKCFKKRESPGVAAGDCEFTSCRLTNFIQATVYDSESSMKAQIKMHAESEEDGEFNCEDFIDTMTDAFTAVEAPGWLEAAASMAELICGDDDEE